MKKSAWWEFWSPSDPNRVVNTIGVAMLPITVIAFGLMNAPKKTKPASAASVPPKVLSTAEIVCSKVGSCEKATLEGSVLTIWQDLDQQKSLDDKCSTSVSALFQLNEAFKDPSVDKVHIISEAKVTSLMVSSTLKTW